MTFINHRWKNRSSTMTGLLLLLSLAGACRAPKEEGRVVSDEKAARELIAQADGMYAARGDLVHVKQGIITLQRALTVDYKNYDAAWRLAKFNYYVGAHTKEPNERDGAFRDGIEAGKLAVRLEGEKPDGHFWLGANYGGSARTGVLAGLSAIEDIRREMETVIRLDKNYQGASAYLVLGQVYLEAPRMFGGDVRRAVELLEEGVKLEKENAPLRVQLARAYLAAKREADARRQLNYVLSMKPDENYLPEYEESAAQARELRDKIK